jgi:hypothetical protein
MKSLLKKKQADRLAAERCVSSNCFNKGCPSAVEEA